MQKKCFLAFLFDENSTGECLCMDGKEVTCAWAPPAKFRSAKGNDYAGEFLFLQNLFCLSFFQVYRKQEKCEEGEEWKEFKGEGFCKILLQYLIFPS